MRGSVILQNPVIGWHPVNRGAAMKPEVPFVSEYARSSEMKPDRIRVVITVPTFRRPKHLMMTLDSLQAQTMGNDVAVVIMDNDAEGLEGARAAAEWLDGSRLKGLAIVAHQRGNCLPTMLAGRQPWRNFPD
jgi:hypothetical protein